MIIKNPPLAYAAGHLNHQIPRVEIRTTYTKVSWSEIGLHPIPTETFLRIFLVAR